MEGINLLEIQRSKIHGPATILNILEIHKIQYEPSDETPKQTPPTEIQHSIDPTTSLREQWSTKADSLHIFFLVKTRESRGERQRKSAGNPSYSLVFDLNMYAILLAVVLFRKEQELV
ncbi:hypothetical protein PanWU01x14_110010 [Parasponia andersonii]|uniref:Uncharacterized protein n=1 Tax=Parasponia andersonii TaxID=3476 RepID=A0A2P5CZ80_PARAD|nr:hypothetical protein PanWU01x14_110010 [Parasponia andersonii]